MAALTRSLLVLPVGRGSPAAALPAGPARPAVTGPPMARPARQTRAHRRRIGLGQGGPDEKDGDDEEAVPAASATTRRDRTPGCHRAAIAQTKIPAARPIPPVRCSCTRG